MEICMGSLAATEIFLRLALGFEDKMILPQNNIISAYDPALSLNLFTWFPIVDLA